MDREHITILRVQGVGFRFCRLGSVSGLRSQGFSPLPVAGLGFAMLLEVWGRVYGSGGCCSKMIPGP